MNKKVTLSEDPVVREVRQARRKLWSKSAARWEVFWTCWMKESRNAARRTVDLAARVRKALDKEGLALKADGC